MKTLVYFLFSSTEWLALIVLTFAMFKLQFKGYWGQIILTAVAMSFLSHFLFIVIDKRVIATVLQPPALFLMIWQIFRIHIFYSALVTVYGYLAYLLAQMSIVVCMRFAGVPIEIMVPNTVPMYIIQSISILIVLSLSWFLSRSRVGFTFIPDYEYSDVKLTGLNLKLFILILLGYLSVAVTNFVAFSSSTTKLLFVLAISLILGILLYLAQRKEYKDD